MRIGTPCYEKPSVVSVKRFLDEGTPALPALLGSMAVRSLLIAGGIWLAERQGVKNPVVKGLFAAAVIEGALFVDAERQNKLRRAYHSGVESAATQQLESRDLEPDLLLKRG